MGWILGRGGDSQEVGERTYGEEGAFKGWAVRVGGLEADAERRVLFSE